MEKCTSIVRLPDEVLLGEGQPLVKEGNVISEGNVVSEGLAPGSVLGEAGRYVSGDIEVTLALHEDVLEAALTAETSEVREVILCWKDALKETGLLLSDHWERGYGDLEWKKKEETGVMPWYFLMDFGENFADACGRFAGFGVKVRPGAMCWWEVKGQDLVLHLDTRCGAEGVLLSGRKLRMAEILMDRIPAADAFSAAQAFCRRMCTDPLPVKAPVYGSNNWYYAYGVSSRADILRDASYVAKMTEGLENRPFMVIDDGWQIAHSASYNGGPWDQGNADYGDMGQLAADIKAMDVHPGIWFRPLLNEFDTLPADWRLVRDRNVLDVSVPEVLEYVKADIRRITGWGYELIKYDFSTYDLFGFWGFDMGSRLTTPGWRFRDSSRTSAEIITGFYRAIHEAAAGDALILGCNCIGHLGAGFMEANRTGDDTSGTEWARTRKMGINTLAFRMPQHGSFFSADADCVGITEKVPWEKNRQWMELLSVSGTPFFVSVKPGTLNEVQEAELRAAYAKASENTVTAVPLDWQKNKLPRKWSSFEGIKEFDWD